MCARSRTRISLFSPCLTFLLFFFFIFYFPLAVCNKTLLDGKLKKKSTCVELYELQDDHLEPKNVVILTARMRKEKREQLKRSK